MVLETISYSMRYEILSISLVLILTGVTLPHAFSDDMVNAQLGTNFEIMANQTVSIQPQGVMLQLVNVTDSRCPSDVTCIWAGQATVNLAVQDNGNTNLLTLVSQAGSTDIKSTGQYVVQLVKVDPYPTSKKTINFSDYIITLRVSSMPPLQQFKAGIAAKDVMCVQGFVHVIKANGGSPACVSSGTATKLVARGWALSTTQ